jgi:hypothetical protein
VGAAKKETKPSVLRVSSDGRALEIRRSSDPNVQRVEVLAKCGLPAVGDPRIRDFKERGAVIAVTFGKHCFADVSLADLSVRCTGCD